MKTLGVIAARGGSKGIPRKNLAILLGKPLVSYTIQAALQSKKLTRIILSSDDPAIIAVGKQLGVDAPFTRPSILATESASSVDVMIHALEFIQNDERQTYDFVCLLQPTAPLRSADDIDIAIESLKDSSADSIVSLAPVHEPHPAKMMTVKDGSVSPFLTDRWHESLRRQDLEPVYYLNGAVYCVRSQILLTQKSLWGKRTIAYIMPRERSVNIDDKFDLMLAEFILKQRNPE